MIDMRLSGKVALVSGGARGMGASHVELFLDHGATVVFGDVLDEVGLELADKLADRGVASYRHLDVRVPADWEAAVTECREKHGGLHILVNNAGVVDMLDAESATVATWTRTIDINQKGVFLGIKHAVGALRASGGGSIINVSSIYGLSGSEGYIAYGASKAAVTQMTKSAAITYGPDNIRVNSIHPGAIRTKMMEEELDGLGDDGLREFLAGVPLGREAAPREVSACVLFLASDASSYVSGTELTIDGGWMAGR